MTTPVILTTESSKDAGDSAGNQRLRIAIHVEADVVPEKEAIKKASSWLLMNAGNLLRADSPELILDTPLKWRLDVWLATPALSPSSTPPRVGVTGRIGQIYIDATTGEVLVTDSLIEDLKAAADALTTS